MNTPNEPIAPLHERVASALNSILYRPQRDPADNLDDDIRAACKDVNWMEVIGIRDLIEIAKGSRVHIHMKDAPVTGYELLSDVLQRAFDQAANGKGKERHANDLPFHEQPMQKLCELYGAGFALGQAAKKAQEAQRLPHDACVRELLGAINYLAGAVIYYERQQQGAGE